MIYADNAATTKLSEGAFEAMKPFLLDQYANASQPYSFSRMVKKALKEARETIASAIGAKPEEIYFTSGGTESDNWAIKSTMLAADVGSDVITSLIEHHAVLNSVKRLETLGYTASYLSVDRQGIVHTADLLNALTEKTKLVSVMLSNNEVGTIEPVSILAEIAHAKNVLFHTDAVQCIGHIPVNVQKLGVDMLSSSAHKFHGPKSIGFLYIRDGVKLTPYQDGGAQESDRRAGTENVASIVGMAAALKESCQNMERNQKYILSLEYKLLDILNASGLDFLRNGAENHVPGNISLSFKGAQGEMLLHRLDLMGICVSNGSACDSQNTQISHVLKAMQIPEEYAVGTIRISLGENNSIEEIEKIAVSIVKILSTYLN